MARSREEIIYDAQVGREKLRFGNPVLCMEWVRQTVDKYGDEIAGITENLTLYTEEGKSGLHVLEDVSVLIAKLEHHLGTLE